MRVCVSVLPRRSARWPLPKTATGRRTLCRRPSRSRRRRARAAAPPPRSFRWSRREGAAQTCGGKTHAQATRPSRVCGSVLPAASHVHHVHTVHSTERSSTALRQRRWRGDIVVNSDACGAHSTFGIERNRCKAELESARMDRQPDEHPAKPCVVMYSSILIPGLPLHAALVNPLPVAVQPSPFGSAKCVPAMPAMATGRPHRFARPVLSSVNMLAKASAFPCTAAAWSGVALQEPYTQIQKPNADCLLDVSTAS